MDSPKSKKARKLKILWQGFILHNSMTLTNTNQRKMKTNHSICVLKPILLIVVAFFITSVLFAQEEIQQDTTIQDTAIQDTAIQDTTIQDTTIQEEPIQEEPQKEKQVSKRKDSFKVFGGGTINSLNVSPDVYETNENVGFMLGVSYKRGKFFYYELGARYNQYAYTLTDLLNPENGKSSFSVRIVDVPITGGVNLTSYVERILGVRIFVGVVPAFRVSVGDNNLGITKESTNSFVLHGQGGIGLDVAFIFLEAGFNYGFSDLLENDIQSNPVQVFINLGFRF